MILTLMICFFFQYVQLSVSSYPTVSVNFSFIHLCMFCSPDTCDMHCKQHKLSKSALFALGANFAMNIVKKETAKTKNSKNN